MTDRVGPDDLPVLLTTAGTFITGFLTAQTLVNVAFLLAGLLLALVGPAIWLPAAGTSIPQETFATAFASSGNIVAGSLLAYLLAQYWDVFVSIGSVRRRQDGCCGCESS